MQHVQDTEPSTEPSAAQSTGQAAEQAARWKTEAEFFDRLAQAAAAQLQPIDPLALRRYGEQRRRRFNKEFQFRLLGDLRGKRVLDLGCGDGLNSVLLAKLGAQVTGLDVSPEAIAIARRRAELDGVTERTEFICAPVEQADLPAGHFDVVWGHAILHHLIDVLPAILRHVAAWTKPDGVIMFAEPVRLSGALRRLRAKLPIATEATPDERPLEQHDLALIGEYVSGLRVRHYYLLDWLSRFVLVGHNYERSSWPRRAVENVIVGVDYALLSLPLVRRLGGKCVIYGRPNVAKGEAWRGEARRTASAGGSAAGSAAAVTA